MKRRDVLKSIGALGAARLLSACGGEKDTPGIRHVVLLMMENRSYDHWLGARAMVEGLPGDGLTAGMSNQDANGTAVPIFPATADKYCVPDPPHGWDLAHVQFADGANTGFVVAHQMEHPGDTSVMQYMLRADLPVTWALADAYATCDRWFASVMGPTWPNRMFWLSGTSMGMTHNDLPTGGYTAPTIFDRLEQGGIDWQLYYGDLPFAALLGTGVQVSFDGKLQRMTKFFADCADGTLPQVSYIDPPFAYGDDHPPHDPPYGQAFLASVYNALASSPLWPHCLLIVTYDEHGGFFDHVPPPKCTDERASEGFDQLGFRVPALAIGPYVKAGHVSSVVRDHTSALHHLEGMFGLAPLTARSTAAADLSELLDEERLARGEPMAPVAIPSVTADVTMIPPQCQDGGSGVASHPVIAAADAHPEWVARWDARAELPALWREIAAKAR
ncbi:MAG TPA: alkaline phosphatase family protein [Kofleriaceae bacterium]|nr:alkaline phosphatase family protein [Kofleriaceae bacterium]